MHAWRLLGLGTCLPLRLRRNAYVHICFCLWGLGVLVDLVVGVGV